MSRRASPLAPAVSVLFVPLLLLVWFGSSELSRLTERAEAVLRDQADKFLRDAARRFEEIVATRAAGLLSPPTQDLTRDNLVLATRALSATTTGMLDLFLLDPAGALLFPRPPPTFEGALPGYAPALLRGNMRLRDAEILEQLGDLDGARSLLERSLSEPGPAGAARDLLAHRMRAAFQLGGILRRLEDRNGATHRYRTARDLAADLSASDPRNRAVVFAPAIELLAEAAIAELSARPEEILDVMRDISIGLHDDVPDELLREVLERLQPQALAHAQAATQLADLRENERHRRQGRRFALDYQRLMQETMRRRLEKPQTEGLSYHALSTEGGSSLLVVRPASARERDLRGGAWIGVRLDTALLVNQEMDRFLTPDRTGFFLAIRDPDGSPILLSGTGAEATLQIPLAPTERASLGGLVLQAVPADPDVILDDRRATVRARALLILTLCLVAGGGAFLLLRSARREAELARIKVDLVSRVSHELKTPLALIKMYAETLLLGRAQNQEQSQRFAGIITQQADRLTLMIQRILDFAHPRSGPASYHKSHTDLSDLVECVTDRYRLHLEGQNAPLSVTVTPDLWASVDRDACEAALVNLLENAVKYTPKETADRTVEVVLRAENGTAVLEVLDRGIGIPEREQARVFEGFYRATNAGDVRGAGIGLSIVRQFAQAHGGTIQVHNRIGGGTIMRLSLPMAAATNDKHEART
jgi:signal transduction histidine kinase